mmetsp:Transcript_42813/g.48646  ORF Transcript_42813/g.48646 Transcript_42813/m.48646 type:complete len:92 (-) Transcript_42813:170-445(-)
MISLEHTDTISILGNGAIKIKPYVIELPSDAIRRIYDDGEDSQDSSLLHGNTTQKKGTENDSERSGLSNFCTSCFHALTCGCCKKKNKQMS